MLVINGHSESGVVVPFSEYGNYQLFCDFADITLNEEEEKLFDYQLAQNEYMAKWRFLVRHLGVTEDEAKLMVKEAVEERNAKQPKEEGLYGEE